MEKSVFELPHYMEINQKREDWLKRVLRDISVAENLTNVIDVGCGEGYFSNVLEKLGFKVTAIDGREGNVANGKKKYPSIQFKTANIESDDIGRIGNFELVLCLGLIYHLENPFKAIRNLSAMTAKHCIIETRIAPGKMPLAVMLDEFGKSDDQGIDYIALIPSKSALVKMLYQAGFKNVYESQGVPDHPEFKKGVLKYQRRTCLVASKGCLPGIADLKLLPEEKYSINWWSPWQSSWGYRRLMTLAKAVLKRK